MISWPEINFSPVNLYTVTDVLFFYQPEKYKEIVMEKNAEIALRAAKLQPKIGRFAARRMVERAGCPIHLYTLARQLLVARCVD